MNTNVTSRRNFLKLSGIAGTALCLGFYSDSGARSQKIVVSETGLENAGTEMNAWIYIDTNGKVTLIDHRAEMGQGSYQSVPQILAEELEVNLNDVNIVFAQANQQKYGSQITGGSSTIRGSYKKLLKLGATAKTMLIMAAAAKWNVPAADCYAQEGHVIYKPNGNKINYGDLVSSTLR